MPAFMLFREPRTGASAEYARALWLHDGEEALEGLATWTLDEQRELARTLRELDPRLAGEGHEDDAQECITLSTETDPGLDYEVMRHAILVDVDTMGPDAAGDTQLLADTLDTLDRIAHRTGLLVWAVELGRIVDPRRDAEAIRSLAVAATRPTGNPRLKRQVAMIAIVLAIMAAAWSWILGRD